MFRLQIARDCAAIRSRCNGDESAALTAPLARAGRSEPSEGVALLPYIDPIAELRCIVGEREGSSGVSDFPCVGELRDDRRGLRAQQSTLGQLFRPPRSIPFLRARTPSPGRTLPQR
jgi:hypothetical protein